MKNVVKKSTQPEYLLVGRITGRIPHALGMLSEIESLDLSWNQLRGEIPQSLEDISALAALSIVQTM